MHILDLNSVVPELKIKKKTYMENLLKVNFLYFFLDATSLETVARSK